MKVNSNTRVVIKRNDGGVSIVCPSPGLDMELEDFIEDTVPGGYQYEVTTADKIPTDRTYRDAWTIKPGKTDIEVDIDKAKLIHSDKLRRARDELWPEFDKRYLAAQRDGKDLAELEAERQILKDIPNNAEAAMKSINDIDSLKTLTPIELAEGISKGLFPKEKLPPSDTDVMPKKEYLEYKKKREAKRK